MTKIVDHEARRKDILQKALKLFADLGYPQVNFQNLADACGLSRSMLYNYFENKREILDNAILYLVQSKGKEFTLEIVKHPELSAAEQLYRLVGRAVDLLLLNPALLRTIIEYLIAQRRQGESVERKIHRHTILFQRALKELVAKGVKDGEMKAVQPQQIADILFALIQSVVIKIMFYDSTDRETLLEQFKMIINSIKR